MQAWIKEIAPNLYTYRAKFFTACSATVEMFWKAGLIAFVIGLLFGILLVITRKGGIRQNPLVYQATNLVINIFRSIPFIILLIFLIPLTRSLVGTAIGVNIPARSRSPSPAWRKGKSKPPAAWAAGPSA